MALNGSRGFSDLRESLYPRQVVADNRGMFKVPEDTATRPGGPERSSKCLYLQNKSLVLAKSSSGSSQAALTMTLADSIENLAANRKSSSLC